MTSKCNQTGCDNPAAFRFTWPGDDEGVCAEHAPHVRLMAEALGCNIPLIALKEPADELDPEAVECEQRLGELTACGIGTEEWIRLRSAIISRYLQKAREDASERLNRECDVLKESNDKLRDQLCANTKLISELQHTVRLVQETRSQQVHECAVKAFDALEDAKWLDYDRRSATDHKNNIVRIICDAFGAPAKDECEEAAEAAWEKGVSPLDDCTTKAAFKVGFKAAWKLAKGEKG